MQPRNANDMTDETGNPTLSMSDRLMAIGRAALAAVALGIGFAWLRVYETGEQPFLERVIYWSALMGVGIAASEIATPVIYNRLGVKWHFVFRLILITLVISIPVTIGLVVIEAADGSLETLGWTAQQYLYVVVISAILTAGAWGISLLQRGWAAHGLDTRSAAFLGIAVVAPPAPAGATVSGAFMDRLPMKMRAAELYAIQAEDHYLRVHTSAGQEMILMRLA